MNKLKRMQKEMVKREKELWFGEYKKERRKNKMLLSLIAGKRLMADKNNIPYIKALPFHKVAQAFLPEDFKKHRKQFDNVYKNAQRNNIVLVARIAPEAKVSIKHYKNFVQTFCNIYRQIQIVDIGVEVLVPKICKYNIWQYYEYYRIAYPILKRANKVIIAPGFTMINEKHFEAMENCLKTFKKEDMMPHFIGVHIYPNQYYQATEHMKMMLRRVLAMTKEYNRPLIITETGFNLPTDKMDWLRGRPWYEYIRYLALPNWRKKAKEERMENVYNWVFHCERKVYEMYWYQIINDPKDDHFFGIYDKNWRPTELFDLFKNDIFPELAGPPA